MASKQACPMPQWHGAIPEDREKTIRKNKKAWRGQIYPLVFKYKEVIQET
jgi:hypothetical protein